MTEDAPKLAQMVLAGEQQSAATDLGAGIFMVRDISNLYLVTTGAGDVLVNTGFMTAAARNKAMIEAVRTGPLTHIILTQSHADHFGGVPTFQEAGTRIVAERRFAETARYYRDIAPCTGPRQAKLWGSTVTSMGDVKTPEVEPDITVDGRLELDLGGRRFVLLSTPGGETVDSLTVWLPDDRIAFTGNLFGPIWLSMPFLNTIRGDKPRLVGRYLESLEIVRGLDAQTIITGHGDPIRGADVKAGLDRMHDAVSWLNEAVIAGMNAGKDVYALMREISLPEHLRIGEFHGNVRWAVRAIYHEYVGWFLYDSTTSLYGVPRSSVDRDLVDLAGGADALAARAASHLAAGRPLEAMHLIDIALGAEPANRAALEAKRGALGRLLADGGGTNLSETMWLRSEIAAVDRALEPAG
ncbi:MBL fold metallo-hydrolase [Novosphingobium bradum]|uniref:MBL fold metallo-hydrolase n=1 Tax=Novosphingobium bradum TaxID=1737444 RepID=A0ABV7IRK4_9SPHN